MHTHSDTYLSGTHTQAHMLLYTHSHTQIHAHIAHSWTQTHALTWTRTHTHTHRYTHMHLHTHTHTLSGTHTFAHSLRYTHMHTHIFRHTHSQALTQMRTHTPYTLTHWQAYRLRHTHSVVGASTLAEPLTCQGLRVAREALGAGPGEGAQGWGCPDALWAPGDRLAPRCAEGPGELSLRPDLSGPDHSSRRSFPTVEVAGTAVATTGLWG